MTETSKSLYDRALQAAEYIRSRSQGCRPRTAIVLGSGLSGVSKFIEPVVEIPYTDIPNFVRSTIEGHAGTLLIGKCSGKDVLAMKGRFHFYEGYSLAEVTLPIRVFSLLRVKSVVITNAAGGIAPNMGPGSLMLLSDHLNLMGDNPLHGPNDDRFGPRFPDMTDVYSAAFRDIAREEAQRLGITLAEGVYGALRGPSFETPAEVRMLRTLGADAIGMSTVPEAIVARHSGLDVLGISCITNIAAGLSSSKINHLEVLEVGKRIEGDLARLLEAAVPRMSGTPA